MEGALVRRLAWGVAVGLIGIVLVFAGIRLAIDVPNVVRGVVPDESTFEHRYAVHAWLAYAHILPGVAYLLLAPFQLSRRFRNGSLARHRRLGRVAQVAGVLSGTFAIAFGAVLSFGGPLQAAVSVVFGAWFVLALSVAYRAIRRRDIRTHRRWMIRAFAVGVAVGTIRLWIGLFEGLGILDLREAFGPAFLISFFMHAVAAELWLLWRPDVSESGRVRRARAAPAT